MNYKKIVLGIFISLVVAAVLLAVVDKKARAQGSDLNLDVIQKLDEIAKDQKTILAELDAIKESQRIILLRVTQQQ
ncbi:MAG: hypothetical protein KBB52_00040 [Candidatus Omnitrophica bacterium]|nr:hypothetical protein [Candidatus Omnitrophota bacterium]